MKERPILFSAPMVKALLAGTKTQTRRVIDGQARTAGPKHFPMQGLGWENDAEVLAKRDLLRCPYGTSSDRLWVRETWAHFGGDEYLYQKDVANVAYRADASELSPVPGGRWRPSIHMPRWASRITLEITEVRVERLQSISREDATAEGARHYDFGHHDGYPNWKKEGWSMREAPSYEHCNGTATMAFANEWNCLAAGENWNLKDGPSPWDLNPWVWALTFRRVSP